MEQLRNLIIENVAMFNKAFPDRFCHSPDVISAISYDYQFTYGQVENEIEKMVHEGVLDAELSDWDGIKLL
ncbi:hypothetical protein EO98_02980 [Methanosarcina sp. 2.H.T.1A.6]|jgi:hypothetical protein|uniref:hypothetical protein n=1 Tax=unclassified Methanosarcina TaxID=2644672 RepID=UPI0006222DD0|nr:MULTISPECIES: hypothetical protein [unclassified Methanosarcina]KKG12058.1 hypothetical protein EO92_06860 [Methanosarcina sp. 2.H.A.1B.4]KKG16892.1 hypothetical protein EO94_03325 [Methanosarcina sp. 2.H.T.1A.3]KKG20427.1 hypothetical protein EO96_06480 [Methanosarcina sp. 2.H.T.1A.8]KKG21323.1 hypothetical protein EO97_13050 [Methanosarcina sp. 2.H.T.1A.15]KKG22512.1 hypothetical protein EO98_02980 [Methanosarcina sp. 2.H.T.1A.6]